VLGYMLVAAWPAWPTANSRAYKAPCWLVFVPVRHVCFIWDMQCVRFSLGSVMFQLCLHDAFEPMPELPSTTPQLTLAVRQPPDLLGSSPEQT
jgi:hypothetical protein